MIGRRMLSFEEQIVSMHGTALFLTDNIDAPCRVLETRVQGCGGG